MGRLSTTECTYLPTYLPMQLIMGAWAKPLPRMTPYIFLQTEIYNIGVSISKHIPCI